MMHRKKFVMSFLSFLLSILFFSMIDCEAPLTLVKARLVETSPGVPSSLDYKSMLQDEHRKYWGIFVSNYYGFDPNPLAAPAEELSIEEKLHKYIIEQELFYFDSDQLALVEQFNDKPMEYKRPQGLVLSMPSDSLDSFVNMNGYGVPILTAAVKDTLKAYKVSFQFFVSPKEAWGYDSLYKWGDRWIEKKQLTNWEAERD